MSERERPPYLPAVPDPWPRVPDFQPAATGLGAGEVASQTIATPEAVQSVTPPPPVDAGRRESAGTSEASTPPEQERVVLTGRVGRDPVFWTTKTGVARAKFPLGSKDEPDSDRTTWREIQWWAKRAERVRDTVRKGQLLEVIAYQRMNDVPGRNGPRQVEEFRGSVVKHRS